MSYYKYTQGLTLIEVLVALVLTIIVMTGTTKLLLHLFDNLRIVLTYQQFEVRTEKAFFYIKQALQNAGYVGCQKLSSETAEKIGLTPLQIAPNSITTQYMNLLSSKLLHQGYKIIKISPPLNIKATDKLVIGDCKHVEVVTATTIKQNKFNQEIALSMPLRYQYDIETEVGQLRIEHLYVHKNDHDTGKYTSALYLKNLQRTKKLIPGIAVLNFKTLILAGGKQPLRVISCELTYIYSGFKKIVHKFLSQGV